MSLNSLYDAIALVRSGKTEDARQIIFDIIRNDPQNEMAWMWLAETLTSEADRMKVLRSCLKINPDSKIAKMAVNKLQKKFNENEVDLPAETPFTEGATFDPAIPERTGHTGAIIGFDGSFILSDVEDFDDVVDLRTPTMATTKLPEKETDQDFMTGAYNMGGEGAERERSNKDDADPQFSAASEIPTIPLGGRSQEPQILEYEPDLSGLLAQEKGDFTLPEGRPPANRVPLFQESDDLFTFGDPDELSSDELGFTDDETVNVPPLSPSYSDLLDDDLIEDHVVESSYEENSRNRKKRERNSLVLVVGGVFLLITALCAILFFVLGGYSFVKGRAAPVPTEIVMPVETQVPTATNTLIPTHTNTPAPTFTPTLLPTATPIVAVSDNAISSLSVNALVLRLKESLSTEFYTNLDGSLAAIPDGRSLNLWDVSTGELQYTFNGHNDLITDAVFSADSKFLVSAARDFSVILWDLTSGDQVKVFGMDANTINRIYGDRTRKYPNDVSVDFSPDGSTLAAGAYGVVNIFDIASGVVRGTYSLTDAALQTAALDQKNQYGFVVKFNENGWVLSAGMSKNLVGLDTLDAAPLYQYEIGPKAQVSYTLDRMHLIEADNGGLIVRNMVDGSVLNGFGGRKVKPNDAPPAYILAENGELLGIETDSQENSYGLAVWDVPADSNLMNFKGICQGNNCEMPTFAFFPESERIAVTRQNNDGTISIIIVNLFSNQIVYRFNPSEEGVRSIAVSPNEVIVAAIDGKGIMHLWDIGSGEERAALQTDDANKVEFSRDGKLLYAWGAKNIQAWGNP